MSQIKVVVVTKYGERGEWETQVVVTGRKSRNSCGVNRVDTFEEQTTRGTDGVARGLTTWRPRNS